MAEAINAEMIPCDKCNTQVSLHDWLWHTRQCVHSEKSHIEKSDSNIIHESTTSGIPCEFCNAQISFDDWQSHSKQCGDEHKKRVEKLKKNSIPDDSIVELIPCEYCDKQINVHDWEWHSRQCTNAKKYDDNNIEKQNETKSNNNLIPCEFCKESFPFQDFDTHQTQCQRKQIASFTAVNKFCYFYFIQTKKNVLHEQGVGGIFPLPEYWDQSSPYNLSRYTLQPDTEEYKFVADNFHNTLPSNEIVQIERIQNRRWYRQYDAHKDDFIERYGKSTEQWLFHGCKSQGVDAIINDCFNRSHAVRCAAGQGIYFATQAATSLSYTQPDSNGLRHMFMARVLVGKTTAGNQSTRICPQGFDTTGGGTVFVTYHDAQAYGEYLIAFR
ncbi:unnamed protein product [Rotaria sp. Silwood2]|nr:unnamed protein product [Rotaria sp. Silwood2]CAF3964292.1 unnamed protein product [Rotaria sp. Silwood2]